MRRRDKYEKGFYHPGTGQEIKVNKRIRRFWKICKAIRLSSWVVVPFLFIWSPWLLILWGIIWYLTILGDAPETEEVTVILDGVPI